MSGVTFDDLVAVATLGVSRKGFAAADLDGPAAGYVGVLDTRDPAAALLDAAALLTVAGRAGIQSWREAEAPRAAMAVTANGERELSARGSQVLARIGMDRLLGPIAHRTGLFGDLLTAMREAGFVLPAPLLPNALDIALRAPELRTTVASVLGPRGRWLAAHRADWQKVADAVAPTVGASEAERGAGDKAGGDEPEVWRVGTFAQRRDYLIGLRDRDSRAGGELLAAGWSRESKEERAGLLAALDRGLCDDDEEFLENALGDRAGEVREVARQLLTRLPESAFSRRAADRAAAVLRLAGDGPDARLVAHVPDEVDKAAVRDGIEPGSPAGGADTGAWRLLQVIAGTSLADWTSRLRLTPAQLVALPVEGAAAIYVRAGWRLATVRQGAARQATTRQPVPAGPELTDWALALLDADLGTRSLPPSFWQPDAALAGLLPADLRAERAAAMLAKASDDPSRRSVYPAIVELVGHPAPWPPVLADAVLDAMAREVLKPKLTDLAQTVVETAGRGMPATEKKDYAAELTRLANAMPQSWMPEVHAAVETINLRRAFLAELR